MLKPHQKSLIKNEKGMAVLELVPTIFIYMLLINFSLGFFGIIHSGILNSIAARNYVFETFRHRPNVAYHRTSEFTYDKGYRYSGIVSEDVPGNEMWFATARPLAFASSFGGTNDEGENLGGRGPDSIKGEKDIHNKDIRDIRVGGKIDESARIDSVGVKSVWIKVLYGICLNAKCGD